MPDPITITLRGPIFFKDIPKVLGDAIIKEVMRKVEERVRRPKKRGHNLGRKNNPIGPGDMKRDGRGVAMTLTSTLRHPRTSGGKWTQKNMAAIKKMVPFVIRKAGREMAKELS